LASWSFSDASPGSCDAPVVTKPVASAAYTFGWVNVYAAVAATVAATMSTTPTQ
jgi:hypothetical protein